MNTGFYPCNPCNLWFRFGARDKINSYESISRYYGNGFWSDHRVAYRTLRRGRITPFKRAVFFVPHASGRWPLRVGVEFVPTCVTLLTTAEGRREESAREPVRKNNSLDHSVRAA